MKKLICVILATLTLFSLVGCGGSKPLSPELDLGKIEFLLEAEDDDFIVPQGKIKTATFIITEMRVENKMLDIHLYCETLDKELILTKSLHQYIYLYENYSEGDYVKVFWREDTSGRAIQTTILPQDLGGDNFARSSSTETSGILVFKQLAQFLL